MAIKIRTNTAPLKTLSLALQGMPQKIRRLAIAQVRTYIAGEIDAQYTRGVNVMGERWPKPKAGNTPMVRTGNLRKGYTYKATPTATSASIVVENRMAYAAYLQAGTSRMAARRHVPGRTLPEGWRREMSAIYRRAAETWASSLKFGNG